MVALPFGCLVGISCVMDPKRAGDTQSEGFHLGRFTRNALLITAACVLLGFGYNEMIHPNLFPKNFGTVVEGSLYRSGELTPIATRRVVQEHGIRLIIDMGAHELDSDEERLAQKTADALGVRRIRLPLWGDATGDPNQYVRALQLIADEANQPVLLHCAAGAERTGCAIAMYRHIYEGVSLEDGLAEATTHRHNPEKNPHVMNMLREWTDDVERSLKTGEPIPFVGTNKE